MFRRPLVPALLSYMGGILLGHLVLARVTSASFSALFVLAPLVVGLLISALLLSGRSKLPVLLTLFWGTGLLLDLWESPPSPLKALVETGAEVTVEATVLEPPRIEEETLRLVVRAEKVAATEGDLAPGEKMVVTVHSHARWFSPGDRVLFPAKLRPFKNFNNPGGYDQVASAALQGLCCAASVSDARTIVPLGRGSLGFPAQMLEALRERIRGFYRERLDPQNRALFQALILGEPHGISWEWRDLFTVTGLGHVLAVSGLHVGLVAGVIFTMIKSLLALSYRLTHTTDIRKVAAVCTMFPVVAYALVAGFHVSSQRAMIMVLVYLFSLVLGREKEIWSSLCLAALIVLAMDPHALFTPSFHLSFGAVVGLLWLAPRIYGWVHGTVVKSLPKGTKTGWFIRYALGLLSATFSVTLFLLPIIVHYFHRVSLVSLPANLIVVPILGLWVLPLGLLASFSLALSPSLAAVFLRAGAWGLDAMRLFIDFWAGFPWAEIWVFTPTLLEMGLFYALMTCLLFWKRRRWAKGGLLLLLAILAGDISYWVHRTHFNTSLRVTFLDVGQGSSALIQFPGKERMLVDGGGSRREGFDMGRMVIAPFLLAHKIRSVDYLVMSHPEADHMDGLLFIAERFGPKELWYNGDHSSAEAFGKLMATVWKKGIRLCLPSDLKRGRTISGVRTDVLHPETDGMPAAISVKKVNWNARSLVLKLTHGRISFILPGDLEKEGEASVVARAGSQLKSDVLLVPHHGSGRSCSKAFLEQVAPRFCVISSRGGTSQGFPHPETLQRLTEAHCTVLRTDQVGAVSFTSQRDEIRVRTFLTGSL